MPPPPRAARSDPFGSSGMAFVRGRSELVVSETFAGDLTRIAVPAGGGAEAAVDAPRAVR